MALVSTTRGYIGKGPLSIQVRGATAAPITIGNCKALSFKVDTDRKARVDYQGAGGGELDVVERVTSVAGEMTVDDFKPENLARALRGDSSLIEAAAVTGEAITLFASSKAFFAYIPDPDTAITVAIGESGAWAGTTAYAVGDKIVDTGHLYVVTVAGISGASEPTWPTTGGTVVDGTATWKDLGSTTLTLNTHYKRTSSGIEALPAATQFDAYGTALTVGYTKNTQYMIQALTDAGTEYLMVFDGLNEVDSGNPVVARLHRVKFSPTAGMDMIGDDFGELKLEFSVLKDETITGAGLSQYLQIAMV
jgi:hypothetical protein